MRIVIAGEVELAAGSRERALEGAQPLIAQALAQPGCRHYAWSASPAHPDRVHVFEEWDSQEELAAHLKGPAYMGMIQHLSGIGIVKAETRKYGVSQTGPVYGTDGIPSAYFAG